MATDFAPVPDWPATGSAGVGAAVADLDGDGEPEVVVLAAGGPTGANAGRYRTGRGLTAAEGPTWSDWVEVPDWPASPTADAGVAVLDRDGRADLVVFVVETPEGQNAGRYRVGRDLAADGTVTGGWGPWQSVPDWSPADNEGADIAVADLDGSGRPDLVVVMVDAPAGRNTGYYRVGRELGPDGEVTGGWSPWVAIPDWVMVDNQGVGAALRDLDGDGRPELIVVAVDNPAGQNGGLCTVGWGLDGTGRASDGWGPWTAVEGWPFHLNQGVAVAPLGEELLLVAVDTPPAGPLGFWRLVEVRTDLDQAASGGVWRLLDFDSEINVVHAALLHTGDVLFFSGSGNDPDRLPAGQFRTRLWHYPSARLDAPDTPLDLFCCGHAFLADGRLLAAGGTATYDPFLGLRDAVVFDPTAGSWSRLPDMHGGRWYPALLTRPDGRVLAVSGLGADGPLNVEPEVFDPATTSWSLTGSPGAWPLYAHLVGLADGRVFYTGGQYGGNNGIRPSIWDPAAGTVTEVPGLTVPEMRNQSASVLLPPAQAQRVLVVGGGGSDMHNMAPATPDTAVVDLTEPAPAYRPGPALHHGRMHLSAVLLPDRTVLVTGGAEMEEMASHAAPHAELFDAATETWSPAAASRVPRLYHSVALLAPDGRVITAGSNPARKTEELRIEVFSPAYLFRGPRPQLTLAAAVGRYGETLRATVGADEGLREVSLLRPGATTHSSDNEQRLVDVPFEVDRDGAVTLQLPADPALAPPGWYLVFAVSDTGVPSPGVWLQLS